MRKFWALKPLVLVLLFLTGVGGGYGVAAEKLFFTEWGADADTVLAREQGKPFSDETRQGSRFLTFTVTMEGMRTSVYYAFSKNGLYSVMYLMDTEPEPVSAADAEALKQKLDGAVLAQLNRPRYMLCPMRGFFQSLNYESWFLDTATLAQSSGTYFPDDGILQYFAVFMDIRHQETVPLLRLFEDYWQGLLTDIPFTEKRDLGKE